MSIDNDKKTDEPIDIDTLTDEEFMKLEAPPVVETTKTEENGDDTDGNADPDAAAADAAAKAAGGGDASTGADTGNGEDGQEGKGSEGSGGGETEKGTPGAGEPELTEEEQATETARVAALSEEERAAEVLKTKKVNDDKETLKLKDKGDMVPDEDEKKVAAEKLEQEAQEAETKATAAMTFFDKVSAPFKADGKEIQIRTPEEAIRLMQMGVNYSRRMQEMKPLREMDAMLTAHGLNDPDKLNELIDLSKGSKEAIQKYLAKHNIDPLDLDTSKADAHTTPNYRSDPKDVAFQEAIDNTLQVEGGKELLADINKDWEAESKEALRENPGLFGKLLEQKDTGVYEQINKELLHQRTMGYLAGVPFLQAYEQVGNAMQKAGVFDETKTPGKKGLAPIASGSRKSAKETKTEQTNPNLSSSKTIPAAKVAPTEPDYLTMDDEAFLKLAIPA